MLSSSKYALDLSGAAARHPQSEKMAITFDTSQNRQHVAAVALAADPYLHKGGD